MSLLEIMLLGVFYVCVLSWAHLQCHRLHMNWILLVVHHNLAFNSARLKKQQQVLVRKDNISSFSHYAIKASIALKSM